MSIYFSINSLTCFERGAFSAHSAKKEISSEKAGKLDFKEINRGRKLTFKEGCITFNYANDEGLKIQLFKNFRSRKNVLDFTNIIFENIMSKKLGDIDYNEKEYLALSTAAGWSGDSLNTVVVPLVEGENELVVCVYDPNFRSCWRGLAYKSNRIYCNT